ASLRKLGDNVIASLAVLLIGLGGLKLFESDHNPQRVCPQHQLPLSAITRSHSLQLRENLVIRILEALCLQYVGLPSEKVVASGSRPIAWVKVNFSLGNWVAREAGESSLLGMECPVAASCSGELSGTLLECD
ncbi:hypothetical protein Tco_0593184, partial [Tanacetum coccineum]